MLTKFLSKYILLSCKKKSSINMSILLNIHFYNSSVSQAELPKNKENVPMECLAIIKAL